MNKSFITLILVCFSIGLFAQKPQTRAVNFKYTQSPLMPLNESIVTYNSVLELEYKPEIESIIADAEAVHKERIGRIPKDLDEAQEIYKLELEMYEKQMKIAEEQYQADLIQHEKDRKTAEEDHAKRLQEWKKSGMLNKLETNKPTLRYPRKPRRKTLSQPRVKVPNEVPKFRIPAEAKTQKLFNEQQYADSYLRVGGLNKGGSDLEIKAVVYKMENLKVENKKEDTDPNPNVAKNLYWKEVEYKRPVYVSVKDANGNILYDGDVEGTSDFYLYATEKAKSRTISDEQLVDNLHEISMEYSMQATLDFLNSMFGTTEIDRTVDLYLIKDKKGVYADYTTAFQSAMTGLSSLTFDKENAMVKLKEASTLWETALANADPTNKKDRINEKIVKATLRNLIETNIWLGEFNKAETFLNQLYTMKPTLTESMTIEETVADYRKLIQSERARLKAIS